MNQKEKEQRIKQLQQELGEDKVQAKHFQQLCSRKTIELNKLVAELVEPSAIAVSDHAILRFLERKYNLDVSSIREGILTKDVKTAIEKGATKFKVDGIDFIIKNNVIVTSL